MKVIVTVMVTILLNILCLRGLNVISWIIVFIPFILMTVIVSLLLYIFGLNSTTGSLNYSCQDGSNNPTTTTTTTTTSGNKITTDSTGNIIIYNPYYNSLTNPVYYQSPNIVVPKPPTAPSTSNTTTSSMPPYGSSDPAYQS